MLTEELDKTTTLTEFCVNGNRVNRGDSVDCSIIEVSLQKSILYALEFEFLIRLQVLMTLPSQLQLVLELYTVLVKHFI